MCATGKSAPEILEILRRRLQNDEHTELREAAEQQRQITRIRLKKWLSAMKRISTHVLDTALGKPATGVPVRLERRETSGNWLLLASARTDQDGRCSQLLPDENVLSAGLLSFGVRYGQLFRGGENRRACIPWWKLHFRCGTARSHFHIPLLLSPNGYTTYRGT